MVALPAAASLPVALPTTAASPSTSGIISNLERLSDRIAILIKRSGLAIVGPAEDRAGAACKAQQRAGFHRLQNRDIALGHGSVATAGEATLGRGSSICHRPCHNARRARQQIDEADAHRGSLRFRP
jgi:hypothetical protein